MNFVTIQYQFQRNNFFDHNKGNYHLIDLFIHFDTLITDTNSESLWSVELQGKYIGVKNKRLQHFICNFARGCGTRSI